MNHFEALLGELGQRTRSAVLSRLGFVNKPLYCYLENLFSKPLGETGCLLADPTFEPTFGWRQANETMAGLADDLLSEELVTALDQAKSAKFERAWCPYLHQKKSWEILDHRKAPQSLIVTSGTGSGKTECFMVPILDHLLRASAPSQRLVGVRALFLYPLNALINSQRDRLSAWTEHSGKRVRFCLYNGTTPEKEPAHKKHERPNEVLDREDLRESPPPILVTNATMLEYMLVRDRDAPILEQSQGKLEWVVLDEAHSYLGSQAAEISLLIRRVLHGFGVRPEQVRFVATSATIGDPKGEAGKQLERFLADIAGVDARRVHVVAGERVVPELPQPSEPIQASLDALRCWDDAHRQPDRYAALAAHPTARRLRRLFLDDEGKTQVRRLSDLCKALNPNQEAPTREAQKTALQWLDLLHSTTRQDKTTFLPLRGHFFHQTLSGLWACADSHCREKQGELKHADWPFGQVYLDPRKHCGCGAPVYELAACDDCGTPVLLAEIRQYHLMVPKPLVAMDEFELDMERDEFSEEEDDEQRPEGIGREALIVNRSAKEKTETLYVEKSSRHIEERSDAETTIAVQIQEADSDGLVCPHCGAKRQRRRKLFQPARIGAPFLLGTILPTLLEFAPDGKKPAEHPHRGRRLLTFNDSRQGTARMAARLQQESERNHVRGLVYHLALRDGQQDGTKDIEKLEQDIHEYEALLESNPESSFLKEKHRETKEKLKKTEGFGSIPFNDMARELARQPDFERMFGHYRDNVSRDTFGGSNGQQELARMFLVREFGRRPKVQNNLETLGMVALRYPAIDTYNGAIDGFSLQETRDLLKIAVDFFVRAGHSLEISKEWRHWLGMRFPQLVIVARDRDGKSSDERYWPRAKRSGYRNALVRLLAHVFEADINDPYGQDRIDEVLIALWRALTQETRLLQVSAGGRYTLKFQQMAFTPINKAWICPVTRRFLDTTLKGVTPYLLSNGRANTRCESIKLPLYPHPFGGDVDAQGHLREARRWLRDTHAIKELRRQGHWTVVNDRAVELAPYFVAAEHSAQQPSQRLQEYERKFKDGDVNLLSCSTTMEMGIDIGGIGLVAMNNVPPHPANYLQRAGRAGRRGESHSTALTLCKANPHDQMVFGHSDWPFTSKLPAPVVSLDSVLLVQRHMNALALSHFLKDELRDGGKDHSKLVCRWFFEETAQLASPAERFRTWCESDAANHSVLMQGVKHLRRRSALAERLPAAILRDAGETMGGITEKWILEWDRLAGQLNEVIKENGENAPAAKAMRYQQKRIGEEYLLRELSGLGFLPGYGFPTHIAAFDNLTVAEFKRNQREREESKSRDDNRFQRRELANRDTVMALREYAPGAQVVIDGLVYRSAGITLNWKIPAGEQEAREVQAIQHAWRCSHCGASGWERHWDPPFYCPDCDAEIKEDSGSHCEFIAPAGFAVDFYKPATNDVSTQDFIPVEPAWVSVAAGQAWSPLENPMLGRFRTATDGSIAHQSRGLHGQGYALCLYCGRAEPLSAEDETPKGFQQPHFPLRGPSKKDSNEPQPCRGSTEPFAIKKPVALGDARYTDVLEIQLKELNGRWLQDRVVARTLAVALRDVLAEALGVQAQELGCVTKPTRPDSEDPDVCESILIYDHFAAGFASSADRFIGDLFKHVWERLEKCPADCDSACPHCVLDFDQRFDAEHLDRKRALEFLTKDWLDAYRLPDEQRFFGDTSRMEFATLEQALLRTVRRHPEGTARLYAAGFSEDCDLGASPWRTLAYRLAGMGVAVQAVATRETLNRFSADDWQLLAGLVHAPSIEVREIDVPRRVGNGWIIAEFLSADGVNCWAITDESVLLPGLEWGDMTPLIFGEGQGGGANGGVGIEGADPRLPQSQSDREIELHYELDGPADTFGNRFWTHLCERHTGLGRLLDTSDEIIAEVHYRDRYLFSPLPILLFNQAMRELLRRVGEDRWPDANVRVTTLAEKRGYSRGPSRLLWHDWSDMGDRNEVFEGLLLESYIELRLDTVAKSQAAHSRTLELVFASGKAVRIRLDQGFSYWRGTRSRNASHGRFDFRAKPHEQVYALERAELNLTADHHPTQFFVKCCDGDHH